MNDRSLRIHSYDLQSYILREVLKIEDVTVVRGLRFCFLV